MLKKFSKKKTYIIAAFILIGLNVLAFYFVKQSIGIKDALEHVENQKVIQSLQQKSLFYNIFSATVITIDLVAILLVLYLLHKLLFKTLKKSIPTK